MSAFDTDTETGVLVVQQPNRVSVKPWYLTSIVWHGAILFLLLANLAFNITTFVYVRYEGVAIKQEADVLSQMGQQLLNPH